VALILPFRGVTPSIDPTAWIAPSATLIGDVIIGAGASIWFGAVLRGDMDRIELGAGSNLQDNVVVHTGAGMPALIGENVGVGHQAIIHGARIGSGALVGMGAKLLNGSVVGDGALVAAGALVLEGQEVPPGHLAAGLPAKLRGPLSENMAERVRRNAFSYRALAREYAGAEAQGETIDHSSGA
jgi:carbonic anhydrase/acetyltransferase-like protein (isoleucine patch superfamily)